MKFRLVYRITCSAYFTLGIEVKPDEIVMVVLMMGVSRLKLQFMTLDVMVLFFAGGLLMIAPWTLQILLDNMAYADDDEALQDEDVSYYMS